METNGPLIWREVTTPSQSGEPEGNQRTIRWASEPFLDPATDTGVISIIMRLFFFS